MKKLFKVANVANSLESVTKKIRATIVPPMETKEILGEFIDQELPKYLNGRAVKGFSRYYRILSISLRESILRLNDGNVWHIPSNARTYPSKDELAWAIMRGEASPIISPNGEKVYLFRDDLRHHAITVDKGAWIVSYMDWSGITEKVRYTSMPVVIRHQHSRDYLREKCRDGWKSVGKLAFPDEETIYRVTSNGFIETTSNPFGDSGWTTTGRNCLDASYWVWVGNQAAVADTETNTIAFYSADGVLSNVIVFDMPLLSMAKCYSTPGAILAVTKEAVMKVEVYKTSWNRVLLYKNPFVLEDGTVFAVNEDGIRKVIELNEKEELEQVHHTTTIGLPGKIENISVQGYALVVKCEGIDEEIALF